MNIYLTRHGQTRLNKNKIMQGHTDEPLNEVGIRQAQEKHEVVKDIKFDAVYCSPLIRAVQTAKIISGWDEKDIIKDPRIIELSFGPYEGKNYYHLGFEMSRYWLFAEHVDTPDGVETKASMIERSQSFLKELETKNYKNVLVVCHGGIIRALRGYLEDRKSGLRWWPKPKNAQILVYSTENGKHKFIKAI